MDIPDVFDSDVCRITVGEQQAMISVDSLLFEAEKLQDNVGLPELFERLAKPSINLGQSGIKRMVRAVHFFNEIIAAVDGSVKKKATLNSTPSSLGPTATTDATSAPPSGLSATG